MQHFARQLPSVLKKSGVSISDRILADLLIRWSEIIGNEFAAFTLPYKITWMKARSRQGEADQKQAALHILCPDAAKTRLMFQEALILDRCNRQLKRPFLTQLRTHHSDEVVQTSSKRRVTKKAVMVDNPDFLNHIQDPQLRRCLTTLGQAIASENQ